MKGLMIGGEGGGGGSCLALSSTVPGESGPVSSEPPTATHPTATSKLSHPHVPGEGGTPIDAQARGGVAQAWWGEHGVGAQDGPPQGGGGTGQGCCLADPLLLLLLLLQL